AVASQLHGVGVRAGRLGGAARLHGDLLARGRILKALFDVRIDVGAAKDHRAGADLDLADLLLLVAGSVGGVRHIDGNADVRMDAVGARGGAAQADLLLDR